MAEHFNIAVIGSGPGGYIAALKGAQLGGKVAIIEQHPFFGGTCLNWGCIPSKALIASAHLVDSIRAAESLGIEVDQNVSVNWEKIQKRKDRVLNTLRGGIKSLFGARGVTSYHGHGRLDGKGKIVVQKEGEEAIQIAADNTILAFGSLPSRIPGWPEDAERICTSDEALHWKTLPQRLLIVGGGVIGCEFACMLNSLGVGITVVEMMPSLLPGMDLHLSEQLLKEMRKQGIECHVDCKVDELSLKDDETLAQLSSGEQIAVDRVLVATGRKPATEDCGLDTIGLSAERGFIRVNDRMETSVSNYYCIGDANGRCLLAHAASAQGEVAARNALGAQVDFEAPIPSCVFTSPEIAAVGMTQQQARENNIAVSVGAFPLGHLGKAMAVGHTEGFVKVIRERSSGELLGVHMMGHNVTECIASATALLHQKVTAHDVAETVFAHPTISEALKEAAEDSLGMALHLPPRKVVRVKG